jgi:hypothetical protein
MGGMIGAVYALSHYNPDHSPWWPVPAIVRRNCFVTEARAKEGGTLEYALEAGEQNSSNAVTKEKACNDRLVSS